MNAEDKGSQQQQQQHGADSWRVRAACAVTAVLGYLTAYCMINNLAAQMSVGVFCCVHRDLGVC